MFPGCYVTLQDVLERGETVTITMAELAKKCGFSKATVSRALADDPRVKPETKAYIQEMAKKYNYEPHVVASNLARRRTKTIGLMFPKAPRTIADPFFLEYLHGVSETLFEHGYSLLIPQVKQARVTDTIRQITTHNRVDGIILTEPKLEDERITLLQERGVPFVFLGSTVCENVSWVDGDNVSGAYEAVRELVKLGHEEIAIITGEEGLVSTRNRFAGYEKAMEDFNLPINPDWIWEGDFTREGGFRAVRQQLEEHGSIQVTAIFASNDLMAIGAIQALREVGYEIPQDISVIGFDGIEVGQYLSPPLTTVQQPIYHLGQQVSQVLVEQIENGGEPVQIKLPVQVVNATNTIGRPS